MVTEKRCSCCKEVKDAIEFNKDKHNPHGLTCRCKQCQKEERDANPEKFKAKGKKYRDTHQEEIKQYVKDNKEKLDAYQKEYRVTYYQDNKEDIDKKNKKWLENNRDGWNEWLRGYKKKRLAEDDLYRISCSVRACVRRGVIRRGFTKKSSTGEILGCDWEFFMPYIEAQFIEGMIWDNYGEWHLDHIIPLCEGSTYEGIVKLNHYTNFQPLWADDNMRKGGNRPDKDHQFRLL